MTQTSQGDKEQYAIQHPDGRWLYHLPNPGQFRASSRTGVYADGASMTPLGDSRGEWWATDHQAGQITAVYQQRPMPVSYRLNDPAVRSDRYPDDLSVEEWNDRSDEDDTYYRFYKAVNEDQPEVRHNYPGPFTVLEGTEPPTADALPWVADLPQSLTQRPQYLHCFGGSIPGLREHIKTLVERMPHVEYCFVSDASRGDTPGLKIHFRVPYAEPLTRWQPDMGRGGREKKSGRHVPVLAQQRMHLPVPSHVSGPNYAAALADWEQQIEFWVGIIRDANVKACNQCNGTGRVLDADPAAKPL